MGGSADEGRFDDEARELIARGEEALAVLESGPSNATRLAALKIVREAQTWAGTVMDRAHEVLLEARDQATRDGSPAGLASAVTSASHLLDLARQVQDVADRIHRVT